MQIWTYFKGEWREGNTPILGAADHGAWLGSLVFDGARTFEDVSPDLDLHCARTNDSARKMGLNPTVSNEDLTAICLEGIRKFAPGTPLYIRPMAWATGGKDMMIPPDADTTEFAVCIEERPIPGPVGITITTTQYRRPTLETMPTDLKAGCLYPNNARMLREAREKGFQNAIVLDQLGNVAETATSNIFMVKDGEVFTPIPTGCFLNGITRQRVIKLLKSDGIPIHEKTLRLEDFRDADELFTSGNAHKVMPIVRFDDRHLQYGTITKKVREMYWDFAHSARA